MSIFENCLKKSDYHFKRMIRAGYETVFGIAMVAVTYSYSYVNVSIIFTILVLFTASNLILACIKWKKWDDLARANIFNPN